MDLKSGPSRDHLHHYVRVWYQVTELTWRKHPNFFRLHSGEEPCHHLDSNPVLLGNGRLASHMSNGISYANVRLHRPKSLLLLSVRKFHDALQPYILRNHLGVRPRLLYRILL